jgi:hypothetical protein
MILRNVTIGVTVLIALLVTSQFCQGQISATGERKQPPCPDDMTIRLMVEGLGYDDRPDQPSFLANFDKLAKAPVVAACYLIGELHVVPETVITAYTRKEHKPSMHVIWSLRALRYITGALEFRAKTKYEIKNSEEPRKYWLTYKKTEDLPFFAVWPSRDAVYISPPDTQAAIIEKWRRWYSESGQTFEYKTSQKLNEWYFFLE